MAVTRPAQETTITMEIAATTTTVTLLMELLQTRMAIW